MGCDDIAPVPFPHLRTMQLQKFASLHCHVYCKFLRTCVRQNFLGKLAHYDEPDIEAPRALENLLA